MNTLTANRTRTHSTSILIGALAALALGAGIAPIVKADSPVAVGPDGAPQVVIKYDRDRIRSEKGARDLYRRIEMAAQAVCPQDRDYDLVHPHPGRQCREAAVARAVSEIHEPRLVQIATGKSRGG
jgi:UrcA family protein